MCSVIASEASTSSRYSFHPAMASTLHTSHHGEPSDLVRDLFQIRFQCTCVL